MPTPINPMSILAAAPLSSNKSTNPHQSSASWFEAMADAWGKTLDAAAGRLEDLSAEISNGNDKPQVITQLSAEALKMGFLSNSSHTSLSSVGSALETMARKQ
jgi:hypothetical protein